MARVLTKVNRKWLESHFLFVHTCEHCRFALMYRVRNKIAQFLKDKKQNPSWLAFNLKVSRAYVSRVISGKLQPGTAFAFRIARCLGKPVEAVFSLDGHEVKENPGAGQFPDIKPSMSGESVKAAEINNPDER